MRPGKFYITLNGNKYFVKDCTVITEPVKTRKFKSGIPLAVNNKLVFTTPRDFVQIEALQKNGEEIDPLSIIKK